MPEQQRYHQLTIHIDEQTIFALSKWANASNITMREMANNILGSILTI